MFLPGKRLEQLLMATRGSSQQHSHQFYMTGSLIGKRFIVETGAEISVVSPSAFDRKHCKDSFSLLAVNNTPIATYVTVF